jgi:spiro-SPASM protein
VKIDVLLFTEKGCSDDDLTFNGNFLPQYLADEVTSIDGVSSAFFACPDSYEGKLTNMSNNIPMKDHDDVAFWKELFSKSDADHIVKIYSDSPFLDSVIIEEMIKLHIEYLAEFTYSENLPAGFGCEIVSRELITAIPEFEEKTLPLSKVIKSNINHFDIELYYKEPDIRDKRLSFRCGDSREKAILERISSVAGKKPSYDEIKGVIEKNPEVLYVGPSYVEIELTGNCDLDCIFCFRNTLPQYHGDMDISTLDKIITEMNSFNLPYTVCLGGSGEPMMHPNFYEALDKMHEEKLISTILIETNGVYGDNNFRNYIQKKDNHKIRLIININGYDKATYQKLHGKDNFDTVYENVIQLRELFSSEDTMFVQIMKINETEEFLDRYYDFWDKEKVQVILQKQNTYLGKVEDRRYSDLSPLNRIPCWHLQRDLYFNSNGTASFCKQDIESQYSADNINNSSLSDIWNNRKEAFLNDYKGKLAENPDCESCDEWYTFNF